MIARCFPVVKRRKSDGMIMMVFAVFDSHEEADAFAANANEWYGEHHPLTPLTVDMGDVLRSPPLFPVEAMRTVR